MELLSLRRSDQAATMGSSELAAKTSHRELAHSKTHDTTPPPHQHHQHHSSTGRGEVGGGELSNIEGKTGFHLLRWGDIRLLNLEL